MRVSADDRLNLYRQEGMAPVVLRRGGRSLDVPHGKPVVVIDKDRIDAGPLHLRVDVHGEAATVAARSPLPPRPPLAGRLAQTVATAAPPGAVASTGGCSEVKICMTSRGSRPARREALGAPREFLVRYLLFVGLPKVWY